jgi:hypothetical protein
LEVLKITEPILNLNMGFQKIKELGQRTYPKSIFGFVAISCCFNASLASQEGKRREKRIAINVS